MIALVRVALKQTMWVALGLAILTALYALSAISCALLPAGGRTQHVAADDRPLYVCATAFHADIVVPIDDGAADWRATFPDVTFSMPPGAYVAIGWGDLGFYRDTPEWSDLRAGTVLRALSGMGPATLHVLAVWPPSRAEDCVEVAIDYAGREALARFVVETVTTDAAGRASLIESPRLGEGYYAAKGRYSPWRTCNVWASQALASAGLPVARWAPFSFGVMWPLRKTQQRS